MLNDATFALGSVALHREWYALFGLLATLVCLYAELLRLLALLRNR